MTLYLVRYQVTGSRICMLPFYAGSYRAAMGAFNVRMGNSGLERWRYHIESVREIHVSQLRPGIHRDYLNALIPEEKAAILGDYENLKQQPVFS